MAAVNSFSNWVCLGHTLAFFVSDCARDIGLVLIGHFQRFVRGSDVADRDRGVPLQLDIWVELVDD